MENQVTIAPVSVLVEGKNKGERQMSVVHRASSTALTACLAMKGKVGTEIRSGAVRAGIVDVATQAAHGNYKPLAEMLAIRLGEPIYISSRASFEALPDLFRARVYQAKLGKNAGLVTDKKTGTLKAGAKLALAEELLTFCERIVATAAEFHATRKAEADAPVLGDLRVAA